MTSVWRKNTLNLSLLLTPVSIALPGGLATLSVFLLLLSSLFSIFGSPYTAKPSNSKLKTLTFTSVVIFLLFTVYLIIRFGFTELVAFYKLGVLQFSLTVVLIGYSIYTKKFDRVSKKWLTSGIFIAAFILFFSGWLQNLGILPTSKSSIAFFEKGSAFYRSTGLLPHASMFSLSSIALLSAGFYLSSHIHSLAAKITLLLFVITATLFPAGRATLLILMAIYFFYMLSAAKNWKKFIIYFSTAVTVLLVSLISLKNYNPAINRLLGTHEIQATHHQRFSEFELALHMLSAKPFGYSLKGTAVAGNNHIKSMSQNQSWEFKEWRGIHNYFLALALWWGFPAILFYLLFTCWPIILSIYEKNMQSFFYTSLFAGGFLFYAATDSTIYPEIAPGIALLSFLPLIYKTHQRSDGEHKTATLFSACLVSGLLITSIKAFIVKTTKVYTYHIDNPSEKESWQLNYLDQKVTIPPDGHFVIHRLNPINKISLTSAKGVEKTVLHNTKVKEKGGWNRYIVSLEESSSAYFLETFEFNTDKQEMEIKATPLNLTAFHPEPFPDKTPNSAREFLEAPLENYQLAFRQGPHGIQSSLSQRITRITKRHRLLEQCWEPFDRLLGKSDLTRNTCSSNKHWNSYGLDVYKNVLGFAKNYL